LGDRKGFSRKVAKNAKKKPLQDAISGLRGRHKARVGLGEAGGATDQASDFGQ
jgi:hypothetical protein